MKKLGSLHQHGGPGSDFLNRPFVAQEITPIIDKQDVVKKGRELSIK